MVSLEQISSKIMLVRIQLESPKSSLRQIQTLLWQARSPDLPPIEHEWDQLKRQMSLCLSARDLKVAVQDLWACLPQDNIRRFINSMPDRVAACIAAGGGLMHY